MNRLAVLWMTMALAILALTGASGLSAPDPSLRYSVKGDRAIRLSAGPDVGSGDAGSLPAGASGLVLTGRWMEGDEGDVWEVVTGPGDRSAWAPADRLSPGALDPTPAPLHCSGTEPFWGLKTAGGRARLSQPGVKDVDFSASVRRIANGDPRVFVQRLLGPGNTSGQLVVIRRQSGCSDGMSDLSYPYDSVLTTPTGEVFSGCCRRAGG